MSQDFENFFSDSLSKLGLGKSFQMIIKDGAVTFEPRPEDDYRSVDEAIDDINVVIERKWAIKKLTEMGYDVSFLENIPPSGFVPATKDKIEIMMNAGFSPRQAARILGITLYSYYRACRRNGIDCEKFKPNPSSSLYQRAAPLQELPQSKDFEIKKIRSHVSDDEIKNFLFKEKIFQEECFFCGFKERNVFLNKIPLFLDYVDGDRTNLKLRNLRILCPNHFYLYGYLHRNKKSS